MASQIVRFGGLPIFSERQNQVQKNAEKHVLSCSRQWSTVITMMNGLPKSEARKLALQDYGWILKGCGSRVTTTRTREGGKKNIEAVVPTALEIEESCEEEELEDEDDNISSEEDDMESPKKLLSKPSNERVILEVRQLDKVFKELGCPMRGSELSLTIRSICIATSIGIECTMKGFM